MLTAIRALFEHIRWADARLLQALQAAPNPPPEAVREYAHVLGADEVWLARLEGRAPRFPVWPTTALPELTRIAAEVQAGYDAYLGGLNATEVLRQISYTNSAGLPFRNAVQETLVHVALHAQYHRGRVNLLLRQAGLTPAPVDYIAYIREGGARSHPG